MFNEEQASKEMVALYTHMQLMVLSSNVYSLEHQAAFLALTPIQKQLIQTFIYSVYCLTRDGKMKPIMDDITESIENLTSTYPNLSDLNLN